MRGPAGDFELPFDVATFGGPARSESRNYWIKREGAEPVLVPNISRFGEKDKATGRQNWENVPPGSALEGLLLPIPPGKDYRLLKIVTQPATPEQFARLGNDRAPVVHQIELPIEKSPDAPPKLPPWKPSCTGGIVGFETAGPETRPDDEGPTLFGEWPSQE